MKRTTALLAGALAGSLAANVGQLTKDQGDPIQPGLQQVSDFAIAHAAPGPYYELLDPTDNTVYPGWSKPYLDPSDSVLYALAKYPIEYFRLMRKPNWAIRVWDASDSSVVDTWLGLNPRFDLTPWTVREFQLTKITSDSTSVIWRDGTVTTNDTTFCLSARPPEPPPPPTGVGPQLSRVWFASGWTLRFAFEDSLNSQTSQLDPATAHPSDFELSLDGVPIPITSLDYQWGWYFNTPVTQRAGTWKLIVRPEAVSDLSGTPNAWVDEFEWVEP